MNRLLVRDIMTRHVRSVTPDQELLAVRDLMWDLEVRHLPVVDADGELVGILSQRDLLRAMGDAAVKTSQEATVDERGHAKVAEVMTKEVETVPPDFDAKKAALLISGAKLGCLPVLEHSRIVGIVTEADFVRLFVEGIHPERR